MTRTILKAVSRRFLCAIRFGVVGIFVGMPAGLLAGGVTAGIYGFAAGIADEAPFASSDTWLLMAVIGWGAIGSLYVAAIAGGVGGAFGGVFLHRYTGAVAGAVTGDCVGSYHGLQGPPGARGFVFILLASGAAAGAAAGWVGGVAFTPPPSSTGGVAGASSP